MDSPKYGYHWGNETAAPIVKEIFERLIINDNKNIPPAKSEMPQFAQYLRTDNSARLLVTVGTIQKPEGTVPNFLGKTLKQSIQEAKNLGLAIYPVGTSGRVVWQSVSPGQLVKNELTCTIKLESM